MDLKSRLKQLEDARASGYLNDIEFRELRGYLLSALRHEGNIDTSRLPHSGELLSEQSPTVTHEPDNEEGVLALKDDEGSLSPTLVYLEMLTEGLEVGPHDHRFRLVRKLDKEEKGRVWLAFDVSQKAQESNLPKQRALKFFAPHLQETSSFSEALQDETSTAYRTELLNLRAAWVRVRVRATLAALVSHPNMAKVYGWRQGLDGWPFVEMEYLVGTDLRQLLDQEGNPGLSWARTLELLRPIAAALDYVHKHHHFPHRALKPTNVFITDQGTVKVLDLGLTFQPLEPRGVVRNFDHSGLPQELLPDVQTVGSIRFKQEIAALAALTYEMLTGRSPYIQEAAQGCPILPPELNKPAALPEEAWRVLRQALDYRDNLGPASPQELVQRLEVVQGRPISRKGHGRTHNWVATAVTLGIIGSVIYGWYTERPVLPGSPNLEQTTSPPVENGAGVPLSEEQQEGLAVSEHSIFLVNPSPETKADRQETDDRAFAAAERIDEISAYRLYLQRCPHCTHHQAAEAAIERLQRQAAIDAIKARFEVHLAARELTENSQSAHHALGALKQLEAIHPQDPFIAEGKRRIALAYGDLAKEKLNAGAFAEARHWLTKGETLQPKLNELAVLAEELKRAEAAAQDELAYAQAQRANLRESYQAYLDHCAPLCGHKQEAQAALEKLTSSPPSAANRLFRDSLTSGGQGPEMILILPGTFILGSPPQEAGRFNDEHQYSLNIKRPFAIGKYEVTFAEYDRFAEATGRQKPDDEGWGRERRPVINVSWEEAVAYTQWLSAQTGYVYRLPTEAEWEYAARAGTRSARYWGPGPEQGCDYANAADLTGKVAFTGWTVMDCRDGYVYTAPVGQYQANAYGLFDMLGNVLEWTCTAYRENYQGPHQECSNSEGATHMVARGGSWSDPPRSVRSADRHKAVPEFRDYFLGFRVLRLL